MQYIAERCKIDLRFIDGMHNQMTPQAAFMVLAPVREGRLQLLTERLERLVGEFPGHADPNSEVLPFAQLDTLHDARFVILHARTSQDMRKHGVEPRPFTPTLQFSGECDGALETFFDRLVELAGPGLLAIFTCCEIPPADLDELRQWLIDRHQRIATHYVNRIGRTVIQVREERALRECLVAALPVARAETGVGDVRALRQHLLTHVESERAAGRLTLTPEEKTPLAWRLRNLFHAVSVPLLLFVSSPVLILGLPLFLLVLRSHEQRDPEIVVRPTPEQEQEMAIIEDHFVTNQFTEFGDIKPSRFRRLTLRFILVVANWFTRHIYNRGFLSRIKTIHYARWVFVDDGRRLVFTSTYDGSREAYMDDFINKVGWGLNVIFSNFVSYPHTRWLLKGGAAREIPFKYGNRRHQLPSAVWYNAYPDMTVIELERNRAIRLGAERRSRDVAQINRWLGMLV